MKKKFTAQTRWEYYVAHVTGLLCILALLIWFIVLALTDEGINFRSVFFWMALLLLLMLPYALISFFSSMKTVEVTATGLIISYVFQKHKNVIHFSDLAVMKTRVTDRETVVRPRTVRDTFKLVLHDGRVFEFDRSQFDQYSQMKTTCLRSVQR